MRTSARPDGGIESVAESVPEPWFWLPTPGGWNWVQVVASGYASMVGSYFPVAFFQYDGAPPRVTGRPVISSDGAVLRAVGDDHLEWARVGLTRLVDEQQIVFMALVGPNLDPAQKLDEMLRQVRAELARNPWPVPEGGD